MSPVSPPANPSSAWSTSRPAIRAIREVCSRCGRIWPFSRGWRWRCTCGGLLDLAGSLDVPPVDLGLSVTPLVRVGDRSSASGARSSAGNRSPAGETWVKVDYETPTGSFKDRGTAAMIGLAVSAGARSVVADSSGNAGRSVAAHAAAAGLDCTVFVPAGTDPGKVSAMALYRAEVVEVRGDRAAASHAAQAAASPPSQAAGSSPSQVAPSQAAPSLVALGEGRGWYASHVHQAAFHLGVASLAFELASQLPEPDRTTIVIPAGNGTLVLGLWLGFSSLVASGHLSRVPPLVAVQAAACAPLAGLEPTGSTSATGIAIACPARGPQVSAAVVASGGRIVAVSEEAIDAAVADLAGQGFTVEPTGAVAFAALGGIELPAVAVLTGRPV